MKTRRQESAFTGAAGVHAVASRLFLAGHTVFFPNVDDGTDLMLGSGIKIQVKAGRYKRDARTAGSYYVLNVGKVAKYRGGKVVSEYRPYETVVDFVIFWGIDENRFFVFPANKVNKGVYITSRVDTFLRLSKTCDSYKLVNDHEEAWHLLDVNGVVESIIENVEAVTV